MIVGFDMDPYWPKYGPITLEEHNYREYERRRQAAIRPHCEKCGRFVPRSTIKVIRSWESYNEIIEVRGACGTCGPTTITYGEI